MQKRAFPLLDLPDLSSCRGAFAFPDALHSNPSFAGVRRCRRRGPIAAQITATDKARRESCTEARSGHPARLTICQILKSSPAIKKRACLVLARWGRRDPRGKNGARASSPADPGRAVVTDGMPRAVDPAGFDRSKSWRISASVKGFKDLIFRVRRRPAQI